MALAVFTVVAVTTVIHDTNASQPNFVNTHLKKLWGSLGQTRLTTTSGTQGSGMQGKDSQLPLTSPAFNGSKPGVLGTVMPKSGSNSVSKHDPVVSTPSSEGVGTVANLSQSMGKAGVSAGWSQVDLVHLQQIAQQFAAKVTPVEWSTLLGDLQNSDPTALGAEVTHLLNKDVSPGNLVWLQTHLQGPNAFTQEDVVLLQQAFVQLESSLTPAEKQLLVQQLSSVVRQP